MGSQKFQKNGVPIPKGFTYKEGTKEAGVVIEDGSHNEFVWIPSTESEYVKDTTFPGKQPTVEDTFLSGLDETLDVKKYGGFYIGRYELAKVREGSSYVAKVQPGTSYTNETWFSLYNKCLNLNKSGTATETSMMYGSLWDAAMQWLSYSYDVGYTGNTYSGYGNYTTEAVTVSNSDNSTTIIVKKSGLSQKLGTGQTSYTKSNNIFDLSGNCCDWTQEAYDTKYRVSRGSYYGYGNNDYYYPFSASRYSIKSTNSPATCSSRPQLYIK